MSNLKKSEIEPTLTVERISLKDSKNISYLRNAIKPVVLIAIVLRWGDFELKWGDFESCSIHKKKYLRINQSHYN
jgi:hypothetical protein